MSVFHTPLSSVIRLRSLLAWRFAPHYLMPRMLQTVRTAVQQPLMPAHKVVTAAIWISPPVLEATGALEGAVVVDRPVAMAKAVMQAVPVRQKITLGSVEVIRNPIVMLTMAPVLPAAAAVVVLLALC